LVFYSPVFNVFSGVLKLFFCDVCFAGFGGDHLVLVAWILASIGLYVFGSLIGAHSRLIMIGYFLVTSWVLVFQLVFTPLLAILLVMLGLIGVVGLFAGHLMKNIYKVTLAFACINLLEYIGIFSFRICDIICEILF